MSFLSYVTLLVNQLQQFNQNQQKVIALLEEQNKLLQQILNK